MNLLSATAPGVEKHGGYTNTICFKLKKVRQTENKFGSLKNSAHLCGMKNESQPRFTPGPWTHTGQDGKPGHCYLAQVWGPNDKSLADIDATEYEVEATANAALIAQAPAMYAVMQEFCDRVDRGEVRSRKTYEQFKSILAAARGESKPE